MRKRKREEVGCPHPTTSPQDEDEEEEKEEEKEEEHPFVLDLSCRWHPGLLQYLQYLQTRYPTNYHCKKAVRQWYEHFPEDFFNKASADVIKGRRIVKARRRTGNNSTVKPAPSNPLLRANNPFAASESSSPAQQSAVADEEEEKEEEVLQEEKEPEPQEDSDSSSDYQPETDLEDEESESESETETASEPILSRRAKGMVAARDENGLATGGYCFL